MITGVFNEREARVPLMSAETEPLMGMSLVYGHDLRIQAIEGGKVTIEKLLRM